MTTRKNTAAKDLGRGIYLNLMTLRDKGDFLKKVPLKLPSKALEKEFFVF